MSDDRITNQQRQLAWERDQVKRILLRELDGLIGLAERIHKGLKNDEAKEIRWWADHTQGIGRTAIQVEHLLNRLIVWDEAIRITATPEEE